MKKYILIIPLFLSFFCLKTYSQVENYNPDNNIILHRAGEVILSGSPNILLRTPNGIQIAGGIKLQLFLSKRLSLDADMVLGRDYFHAGPGLIGLPLCLIVSGGLSRNQEFSLFDEGGGLSDFLFTIAVIALSFEHISYHIPVKNNLDVSPYLSLLRYKYAYEHGNYSDPDFMGEQLSFATGIQINKYFGRFVLSPYAEYNIGYRNHNPGYNLGIYCGVYFMKK
jgi:hypothetical protein